MRNRGFRALVVTASFAAACAHAPAPPKVTWTPLGPSQTAVPVADVQVLDALPDNVVILSDQVLIEPDSPSASAPDQLLGFIQEPSNNRAAVIAEAARQGANTLVVMKNAGWYLAMRRTLAPTTRPTADAALSELKRSHEALTPNAEPKRIDLAHPTDVQLTLRRGQCYWLAFALEPDAICRKPDGQRETCISWSFPLEWKDALLRPPEEARVLVEPQAEQPLWTRSFFRPVGCATRETTLPLNVAPTAGARGGAQMQLFTGDISEAAIARWQQRYEELEAQHRAQAAEDKRKMEIVCTVCADVISACRGNRNYDVCYAADQCVKNRRPRGVWATADDCP